MTSLLGAPSRNLSSSAPNKKGRTKLGAAAKKHPPTKYAASAKLCRIDSVADPRWLQNRMA
jgi:hypothetical protein